MARTLRPEPTRRGTNVRGCLLAVVFSLIALDSAHAQTPTGDLRVVVFSGGEPADRARVVVGDKETTTDLDGTAVFALAPGAVTIEVTIDGALAAASAKTEILEGHEVEVIMTLATSGKLIAVDIETAKNDAQPATGPTAKAKSARGTVHGKVTSGGAAVAGARVFARGTPESAATGDDGVFELDVPVGRVDLTVIHPGHSTGNLEGIEVREGARTEVTIEVEKATPELEEFVVSAPHIEGGVAALVAERRESSSVEDVIGAEEMSRTGDGDAAGALKRVTGITVVGGRFIYVRGMGERYSSTLLNGQGIPSPEPERRVIPLNLFSTDVLDSVVIQKTPSPDMPGELGGGVVRLRTKSFPESLTVSASVSSGAVSNATFRERPTHAGGATDFLGFDDGTRGLPDDIREQSPLREGNLFEEGLSPEELAELGRQLPTNYNVSDERTPLARGFSGTIGDQLKLGEGRGGYLVSLSYDDSYSYFAESYRRFVASDAAEGGLELNNDFFIRELGRTVAGSGIVALGYEPSKNHKLKATTLVLRITDSETALVTGRSDDLGRDIRRSRLRFAEKQLLAQQLAGEHTFAPGGQLSWRYAYARATRDEPDRREYFYVDESADPDDGNTDFQISGRPAGNQRIWNDLVDSLHDVGADYEHPIDIGRGEEKPLEIKVGAMASFRQREFGALRLTLRAPRALSEEERRMDPETIWSAENINAETGWILEDTTQPTDAYSANSQLAAAYAMATVPLTSSLEIMGGLRVERSRQEVVTFAPFSPDEIPLEATLVNTDPLPSATVKWQISDAMILRGGFGRTVTRPDFRELSESQYRDVVTATRFVGNPDLERGTIDNIDSRFEFYFSTDESMSAGAFYKRFNNPIEQVDLGGVDRSVSWDNAEGATNIGLELDGRKRFGFVHPLLDPAFAAINIALIRSQVTLGEEGQAASTSAERALQGQSPYVVNAQLGYDDASRSGVLLLNVFGDRIRDVGRLGTPDIFEESRIGLDAVFGQSLPRGLKLKFKAKNLLDPKRIYRQGGNVVRETRMGRSFSVSLSWTH